MDQYAQALLGRRLATERLEEVQRQLSAEWQELRNLLSRGCEAAKVAQIQAYHRVIEKRRDECVQALGVAERRVNAAFQAMMGARRQREVVDKVFEKQKANHRREQLRVEQKFLDDFAGRRTTLSLAWNPIGT